MNNIIDEINSTFNLTEDEIKLINFEHLNEVFTELEDIYEQNSKYDMKWAFHNASEKIQSIYDNEITNLYDHHLILEANESVHEEITEAKHSALNKIGQLENIFSQVILTTRFLEVIVAFFLIMMVHYLTEAFAEHYSAIISITIITIIFAFFKIFMEQAVIHKLMYRREIYLYRKSIDRTKKLFEIIIIFYFELSRVDHQECTRDLKLCEIDKLLDKYHRIFISFRKAY